MRLHKYIAKCGVASRRKAEKLIEEGRVQINGETVSTQGLMYQEGDQVRVDGELIGLEERMVYLLLNKPLDCVTTSDDQFGRTTVLDLIDNIPERVYPVGRLDYNTTGMLLLTNDGDMAHKITHPSSHLNKVYVAKVKGSLSDQEIKRFESGLVIDDHMTSPATLKVLRRDQNDLVEVTIHEGRNRQVRKMLEAIGHPVITLKRIRIGTVELGDLKVGSYRHLTQSEIDYFKKYKVER